MPTGGTLSIRARVLKAGPGPEAIRLLVRDTGRGHDAEAIRRVLSCEPDEAAGEAERRLIATRRVAEALGGTLHLVSARARGTSVVIDLLVAGGTSGPAGRRGAERGAIYDFPRGWA
jgi:signal transduction histidine kinase